jgi:hypothetical protein
MYPRRVDIISGALPTNTWKRGELGSVESQGRHNAICPLLAYDVESYNKMN